MTDVDGQTMTTGRGPVVVPRSVVVITLLVLLVLLAFDLTAGVPAVPWHIPGHAANPIITAGILGLIGTVLTATRGPRPSDPDEESDLMKIGKDDS